MSKALFFNIPAHGHINPTLPVVEELIRQGETIIYYDSNIVKEKIEATGVHFRAYEALSPAVRFNFDIDNAAYNLMSIARVLIEFCEASLPFLLDAVRREQPDYIVHDFTCLWAKYTAEILNITAVATIPQFPVNMKRRPEAAYPAMMLDFLKMFLTGIPSFLKFRQTAKRISRTYAVRQAGVMEMLASHEALNIVFTSRYFQPYPEDFDESFVFVGPAIRERDEKLDFPLQKQRPLIYISLGTIFNVNMAFYQKCFEAFAGSDKQVILSVGQGIGLDSFQNIPPNFIVRNYVPQLEVLKRADVFITHGGMNSVSEGLYYGVPLIVIPQGGDQFFVADRVVKLKAGYTLNSCRFTPQKLYETADRIMADEQMRIQCESISASFRGAGGVVRAADEIMKAAVHAKNGAGGAVWQ